MTFAARSKLDIAVRFGRGIKGMTIRVFHTIAAYQPLETSCIQGFARAEFGSDCLELVPVFLQNRFRLGVSAIQNLLNLGVYVPSRFLAAITLKTAIEPWNK